MKRLGLSRLARLEPVQPPVRYERATPGELLHLDIKKLGRIDGLGHRITGHGGHRRNAGIGWDTVHLAIDDHSRVSFALVKTDECGHSCAQFLRQALAYYASLGVSIERVMTDNGTGYRSKAFKACCAELDVRHVAATPIGMRVRATAELTHVDGRTLTFRVEARDERETIGDGTHQRVVVNVARFDQRVQAKAGESPSAS